jgi:glucosylceramidase
MYSRGNRGKRVLGPVAGTPDKKTVLIVVNTAQAPQTFHIRHRGGLITPVLAPGAVGTYIW